MATLNAKLPAKPARQSDGQVFAHGGASGQADKKIEQRRAMAFMEDAQFFHFAVPDTQHQQFISR